MEIDAKRFTEAQVPAYLREVLHSLVETNRLQPETWKAIGPELFGAWKAVLASFHASPPAPELVPWSSPFEAYPKASLWKAHSEIVNEWPMLYWPGLVDTLNNALPPEFRSQVYDTIKEQMPIKKGRKSSWYSLNRMLGICRLVVPECYTTKGDKDDTYARAFPYSRELYPKFQEGAKREPFSSISGLERNFKKLLLSFLNVALERCNLELVEFDFASCHTKVLVSLFPEQTPLLHKVFDKEVSLWREFEKDFDPYMVKQIGGSGKLKEFYKVVVYACLQGGSISKF